MNLLGLVLAVGVALLAVGAAPPLRGNELVLLKNPTLGVPAPSSPSERPGMQLQVSAGEWNWNTVMKTVVTKAVSYIPVVGQVISFFVGLFWPSTQPKSIWEQVEQDVKNLVDTAILNYEVQHVTNMLNALQKTMQEYTRAQIREKASLLSAMISDCNRASTELMSSLNAKQLLPIAISMAHMHLAILRERYQHGLELYGEDNRASWEDSLLSQWATYREHFRATYPLWRVWREEQVTMDAVVKSNRYNSYCKVKDTVTGKEVYYRGVNGKNNDLAGMCKAIKERIFTTAVAEMIGGVMERSFHINMYLPGMENAPPDVDLAIQNFTVGPWSPLTLGTNEDGDFSIGAWDTPGRVAAIEACWVPYSRDKTVVYQGIATLQFIYEDHVGKLAGSTKGSSCKYQTTFKPLPGTHFTGMQIGFTWGWAFDWIKVYSNTTASEKFPPEPDAKDVTYYPQDVVCDPSYELVGYGWNTNPDYYLGKDMGRIPVISLMFKNSYVMDTAAALGSPSHWPDYMDILAERAAKKKEPSVEEMAIQFLEAEQLSP